MRRFNLLPWREIRRSQRKREFHRALSLAVLLGMMITLIVSVLNGRQLTSQTVRNDLLKAENELLDQRIREVNGLRDDIAVLRARREAVQSLQAQRMRLVRTLDELSARIPPGLVLKSIRQSEQLFVGGLAQSNARVSEFLRNLSQPSTVLGHPELLEIKSGTTGQGKALRRAVEFSMAVRLAEAPLPE